MASQDNPSNEEDKRSIITYNPEEEVWYYFSKLTHFQYVIEKLKKRVSNQFFDLDTNTLMKTKAAYKEKLCTEIYTPLNDDGNLETNAIEITHTARQAIEIYRASQTVSLYAKPILLYYCYVRLAKILFLASYEQNFKKTKNSHSHGLSINTKEDRIVCKPAGFFPHFQDSYYPDPSIYLEGAVFKWQDLLEPPTQRFYLFDNMRKDNKVEVKDSKSNNSKYVIHELARELMFTYSMSMLARYNILKWKDLMEGKQDNIVWKIEGYLKTSQSFFPNLIFNEFHGRKYFFYAESRAAPDHPTF